MRPDNSFLDQTGLLWSNVKWQILSDVKAMIAYCAVISPFQALAKMKESKVHCGASSFSNYQLD